MEASDGCERTKRQCESSADRHVGHSCECECESECECECGSPRRPLVGHALRTGGEVALPLSAQRCWLGAVPRLRERPRRHGNQQVHSEQRGAHATDRDACVRRAVHRVLRDGDRTLRVGGIRLREHVDLPAQKVPEAVELHVADLVWEHRRLGHRERPSLVPAWGVEASHDERKRPLITCEGCMQPRAACNLVQPRAACNPTGTRQGRAHLAMERVMKSSE